MYRRPSELGLATTPMADQSEIRSNFQPVSGGRQHIVKPIPDHKETYQAAVEEWKEENVKETESRSHYKNLGAKRPVCQKLNDHLTLGVSFSASLTCDAFHHTSHVTVWQCDRVYVVCSVEPGLDTMRVVIHNNPWQPPPPLPSVSLTSVALLTLSLATVATTKTTLNNVLSSC